MSSWYWNSFTLFKNRVNPSFTSYQIEPLANDHADHEWRKTKIFQSQSLIVIPRSSVRIDHSFIHVVPDSSHPWTNVFQRNQQLQKSTNQIVFVEKTRIRPSPKNKPRIQPRFQTTPNDRTLENIISATLVFLVEDFGVDVTLYRFQLSRKLD